MSQTKAGRLETRIRAGRFVITAEIVPPLSASADRLLSEAAPLRGSVDAINVTDAAAGRTTVSSLAAAAALSADGLEPTLQMTCRDRNRIALAGDLLGAAMLGIRNLLILHGDDPKMGDQPDAKPVFDLSSRELMTMARDMREEGTLSSGRPIKPPPHFFIGAADVPQVPGPDWDSSGLISKADAGAQFVQTQFCFDSSSLGAYMQRLSDDGLTERLAFIIGVGPIRSAKSARWMNENLYGVSVPDEVVRRLDQASDAVLEGRRICAELIEQFTEIPGVAGVHLMAPGGGAEAIGEALAMLPGRFRNEEA